MVFSVYYDNVNSIVCISQFENPNPMQQQEYCGSTLKYGKEINAKIATP